MSSPNYKALINDATQRLYDVSDTPRIDAEMLMQHITQQSTAWLIAYGDSLATADHIKDFYQLIESRQQGQPIAYLLGYRDFWTLNLKVNQQVLIPRPDTETLVEEALERLPKKTDLSILDLGTGSGAIALSLAKEHPQASVLAVDSQAGALEVAKLNAAHNSIHNCEFSLSNWFGDIDQNQQFDLIASNPPYIEANDAHLEQGDLRFEPTTALVAEDNGLADIKNIVSAAPSFLKKNAWLIIEHGYNQADEVAAIFAENQFRNIELFKDINDLPRCTIGQAN